MCRWVLYFGSVEVRLEDVLVRPEHSLFAQSKKGGFVSHQLVRLAHFTDLINFLERNHSVNADGFGVAFWASVEGNEEVGCFKSVQPIFGSESFRSLARVLKSSRFLAHIRASSPGAAISEANCHPFVFGSQSKAAVAFMHNGAVAHHAQLRRAMLAELTEEAFSEIKGTTDSEMLGAIAFDFLRAKYGEEMYSAEQLLEALQHVVGTVTRHVDALSANKGWTLWDISSSLNICISSARAVAVLRFRNSRMDPPTLFYQIGNGVSDASLERRLECRCMSFRLRQLQDMVTVASSVRATTLIVSSEPFLNNEVWHCVPRNTALAFDKVESRVHVLDVDIPHQRCRAAVRLLLSKVRQKKERKENIV